MRRLTFRSALSYVLLTAALWACDRPPKIKWVPAEVNDEAAGTVTGPPGKVVGVTVERDGEGIVVLWRSVEQATYYEIRRKGAPLPAPGPRQAPPGQFVGRTKSESFVDVVLNDDTEYTYWVVAFNKKGGGPPSAPVSIQFARYPGWVEAAEDWGPDSYVDVWENGFPATADGNAGVATVSPLPFESADFTSCAGTAFAVTAVRPALATKLGEVPQTFSANISYATTTPDPSAPTKRYFVRAYTYAAGMPEGEPLYEERGFMLDGCNQIEVAFTANPENLQDVVIVTYGWEWKFNEWEWWWGDAQQFSYVREAGTWFLIENTVPAWGSSLTTGTLSATVAYRNMPRSPLRLGLGGGYTTYASLITIVAGSGNFTVELPYEAGCGAEVATLYLAGDSWRQTRSVPFTMPAVQAFALHMEATAVSLAPSQAGSTIWLKPYSCNEVNSLVTLTADPGLAFGYIGACDSGGFGTSDHNDCYFTSEVINTSTQSARNYYLHVDEALLSKMGYGSFVSTITAQFGGLAITRPVELNIFDYFWKSPPPTIAQNPAGYRVEVTAVNSTLPYVDLHVDYNAYGYHETKTRLWWDAGLNSYAAQVTYSACGTFQHSLTDAQGYYSYGWSGLYAETEVAAFSDFSYWGFVDSYVSLSGTELDEPVTAFLDEACGKTFRWRVVSAPSWLRFSSLEGSSASGVTFAVIRDEAFATGDYEEGWIWVESLDHPGQLNEVRLWVSE